MPQKNPVSVKSFVKSFGYAFHGLKILLREQNMKFHCLVAILVVIAGWMVDLSASEWLWITICIGLVFASEAFNTSIEYFCDRFHPEFDTKIGVIKDLSAAAVFLIAMTACIIGLIIFLPKII